ncbi:MAG: hypothetical protein AAFY71_13225 [Bacteroidota bacterium]
MISLDNMLCFIFTKKRFLAGVQKPEQKLQMLTLNGQWFLNYEGKSIPQVLENNWQEIIQSYSHYHGGDEEVKLSLSFPASMDPAVRDSIHETIARLGGGKYQVFFEDNLALSFIHGLIERGEIEGTRTITLEALDDYLNIWKIDINQSDEEAIGRDALMARENVQVELVKGVGPSAGRSHLMSELIKEFQASGFSLNLDSQTELAHQLMAPNENYTFSITQKSATSEVTGTAKFDRDRFQELFTINRDRLGHYISGDKLREEDVKHVFLMGGFFQHEIMSHYLKNDLNIGSELVEIPYYEEKLEYETIMRGLFIRTELVLQAEMKRMEHEAEEARRKEEEERKKEMVKAELEAKDARESLFSEIKRTCINPADQEQYEQMFIPRGEQLGIPDVVIKWNIGEILSKISLTETAQNIGIMEQNAMATPSPIVEEKIEEEEVQPEMEPQVEAFQEAEPAFTSPVVEVEEIQEEIQEEPQAIEEVLEEVQEEIVEAVVEEETPLEEEIIVEEETQQEEPIAEVEEESVEEETSQVEEEQNEEADFIDRILQGTEIEESAEFEVEEKVEEPVAEATIHQNGSSSQFEPEHTGETPIAEEEAISQNGHVEEESLQEEKEEKQEESEPIFVLSPTERTDTGSSNGQSQPESSPIITLKKEPSPNGDKGKSKKARFSLGDIFSLKSDLLDDEFITKVVSYKSSSDLLTLRLLKKDVEALSPEKLGDFKKLHQKESAYYGQVSEISESKEGLYFYRPYIERNSLKNYLIRNGFTKKERVEDLSSNELKFILMVFKEVRSLSQMHAKLDENNIIVTEKRKWSLSKTVEIAFVGFSSSDVTNNEMVEATHQAFSRVMGETFYADFRRKFQL